MEKTDIERYKRYTRLALAVALVALLIALYSISVSGAKAQVIDTALPYSKHMKDGFIEGKFPPTAADGNGIKVFPVGYESDYVRFIWNNLVWSDASGTQQGNIISSIQNNPVQVLGDSVFYYAYVNNSKLIKATYINKPNQIKYELELKNLSAPNNPAWRVKEYLTIDDVPASAIIELDDGSAWDKTNNKQSNFFIIKFIDGQKLIIPQPYVFDRQNPSNKVYGYYIMSKAGGKLRGSMISPPYSSWSSMAEPVFDPPVSGGAVGSIVTVGSNQTNSTNLSIGQNVNASLIKSWNVNITSSSNRNLSSTRCGNNQTGLVGCWFFDNNLNDSSGNNINGSIIGNTIYSVGKLNNQTVFDGFGDGVNFGSNSLLNIVGGITILATINTTDTRGDIFQKYNTASPYNGYSFAIGGSAAQSGKLDYWSDIKGSWVAGTITVSDGIQKRVGLSVNSTHACFYVNGVLDVCASSNFPGNSSGISAKMATRSGGIDYAGGIDELIVYNRTFNSSEFWEDYIIRTQQLQVKSTVNNTWSGIWNSSANNPLLVPYASGELASILQFFIPDNQTVDGILCYNCSKQMNFSVISTIQTGEDYTEISQAHASGYQYYNLSYTPAQSYNYSIITINMTNYSDTWQTVATLENSTSRTLSGSYPNYTINFTAPVNGTLSHHNISMAYNNAPTGSISNQSFEAGNPMIVTCTANDAESNTLNISMTVNNTLKQGSSCSFDYTGLAVGNYSSQVNITDLNGTIGTLPYLWVNLTFWMNVSADLTAPAAPVISNGTIGTTTIVLNSTNNTEIGGWYLWEFAVNTTGNYSYLGNTTINTTTATGLTPGQTYDFRLRINDSSNNISPYSNVIALQTLTSDPTDALILANQVIIINNQNAIIAKQLEQDESILNAGATGFIGGILGAGMVIGVFRRRRNTLN